MGALDTLNNWIDGPLAHAGNTLTLGGVDNREVLQYEYNSRGEYVANTLAEKDYRKDALIGQVVAGMAGTTAFASVRGLGTRWGVFAPMGSSMAQGRAIAQNLSLGGRITRTGMMGLGGAVLGVGVALPYLNAVTTATNLMPKIADAEVPLVSDFANRFQPTYLEPEAFEAEEAAESEDE